MSKEKNNLTDSQKNKNKVVANTDAKYCLSNKALGGKG